MNEPKGLGRKLAIRQGQAIPAADLFAAITTE